MTNDQRGRDQTRARERARLRGFGIHLLGYFVVMAALVAVTLAANPETTPWFVLPMVAWGGVLAIHVAYVMGLFGGSAGP